MKLFKLFIIFIALTATTFAGKLSEEQIKYLKAHNCGKEVTNVLNYWQVFKPTHRMYLNSSSKVYHVRYIASGYDLMIYEIKKNRQVFRYEIGRASCRERVYSGV